jgi:membrane protease YdiL (CAAX protease family)
MAFSSPWIARHPLIAFFVLAFAGSWIVQLPLVLAGNNLLLPPEAISPGLRFILTLLAPFAGPTLAAFVVTTAVEGKAGVRALLRRYVQWRFGVGWYLAILLGPLLVLLLGVGVFYGTAAPAQIGEQGLGFGITFLVNLAVNLVIGGILAEEPGWRGFALPRLQTRFGALAGTIVLGVLWSLWHLPLILTPGGVTWTGSFALYMVLAVALAIIHTTVYNGTRASLLSVMLLHAAINTSTRLVLPNVPGVSRGEVNLMLVGVTSVVALLIVALTRGRLAYSPEPTANQ